VVAALGFSPGSFTHEAHGSVTEAMDGDACKGESPIGHAGWMRPVFLRDQIPQVHFAARVDGFSPCR
jgi:hypothetical protein